MAGTTLEALTIELMTEGTDRVASELKRTAQNVEQVGEKAEQSAGHVQSFAERMSSGRISAMEFVVGLQAVVAGASQIGKMLASFSGVKLAAEYERITASFTALLGSKDKADALAASLKKIGEATPFDTLSLVTFAKTLLATGTSAEQTARQIGLISKMGMASGVDTAQVGAMVDSLAMLRVRPHIDPREMMPLLEAGMPLRQLVNAGAGKNFGEGKDKQVMAYLAGQGGNRAVETLMKGMEKLFGNTNANTFLGQMVNLGEIFANIMLPTGKALLPVLEMGAAALSKLGQYLGNINTLGAGLPGLALMVMGVYRAKNLLIGSLIGAITKTRESVAALSQYSVAAGTAAGASRTNAAGQVIGSMVPMGPSVPINGLRANIGRAGGIGPWMRGLPAAAAGGMKGMGGKLAGSLKNPNVLAAILTLGADFAGDWLKSSSRDENGKITHPRKNIAGSILSSAGAGAGIGSLGFAFGPQVGLATTIIGGLIGGIKGYFDGRNENNDPVAANTAKMADSLEAIEGHLRGNVGERGRFAQSQLQLEYAMKQMVADGIG